MSDMMEQIKQTQRDQVQQQRRRLGRGEFAGELVQHRRGFVSAAFANEQSRQQFISRALAGRLGTPEDICGLAVFLASDESAYCFGGVYTADGGLTAI